MRVLCINLQPLSLNSLNREVRRGCQKFCTHPPMMKFVFVCLYFCICVFLAFLWIFVFQLYLCIFTRLYLSAQLGLASPVGSQPRISGKPCRTALAVDRSLFIINPLQTVAFNLEKRKFASKKWNYFERRYFFGNFGKRLIFVWELRNTFCFRGDLIRHREGYWWSNIASI